MLFKDRRHAGERLAERLSPYRARSPLVLAVPRGGVTVAAPVWESLGGDLDLLITRKIGAPYQPELALGAVTGDGFLLVNENLADQLQVSRAYLDDAAAKEQAEIRRRLKTYRGDRPFPEISGRLVLLIDDGVATGFTLLAALRSLRLKNPGELVLAVPVGPPDTLARLRREVDVLHFLEAPPHFAAVGQFYRNFDQVTDDAVIAILRQAWSAEK